MQPYPEFVSSATSFTDAPAAAAQRAVTPRRWRLSKVVIAFAAAMLGLAATGPSAKAAFTATFTQMGSNVIETGSGSINTAALSFYGSPSSGAEVLPSLAQNFGGPTAVASVTAYSGTISGPSSIGNGGQTFASSGTGDLVGLDGPVLLIVPQGYTSGSLLSDTNTYSGQSLSSLGITPGTYNYTFGSGVTADSYTIIAVPEPSAIGLIAGGAVMLGLGSRARRKQVSI